MTKSADFSDRECELVCQAFRRKQCWLILDPYTNSLNKLNGPARVKLLERLLKQHPD